MKRLSTILSLSAILFVVSCKKDFTPGDAPALSIDQAKQKGPDLEFYALAPENRIDYYSLQQSGNPVRTMMVTGLQPGETVKAIDFRPATGQLYALGSTSRLYVIQIPSGIAKMVGTGPLSPMVSGTLAGFDFNPTVDRIRIVTDAGQNLRVNPETGAVITDGSLNNAPGAMVSGAAYANNEAGATTTTLYDLDIANRKLYRQDPPNNGVLVEIGSVNITAEGEGGFDIPAPKMGVQPTEGYALYTHNKKATLYSIDLNTAKASKVDKFDKNDLYIGLAIPTNPVAYAVSMNNFLIFNPMMPSPVAKTISGLQMGETILGIDFRPANNALYALGSTGRIYTFNTSNGAATFVAMVSEPLQGMSFGFDFNPVADRIRIVSNAGQNLRVHPVTGVAINDGNINGATASITGAAYTNSFAGTTTTALYVVDSDFDMLYLQNPPNDGTLQNGKSLGIDVTASNGFDIGGTSGAAYGIFTVGGTTKIYGVNLMTGMATAMGSFPANVSGFSLGLGF